METNTYTGKLYVNGAEVYLDFVLMANKSFPIIYSYYSRSISTVKAVGASLNLTGKTVLFTDCNNTKLQFQTQPFLTNGWTTKIQPMVKGKERFYHAISVHPQVGKDILLCKPEQLEETWYDYLMHNYNLPLLKEWKQAMCDYALRRKYLCDESYIHRGSINTICPYDDYKAYQAWFSEPMLEIMVKELFSLGKIRISDKAQKKMEFENMDQYFKQYGHTIVSNLQKTIEPLTELSGEAKNFTLKSKRLYPQQIATVNGDVSLLHHNRFAILNHGMGTGKVRRLGMGM